MTLVAIDPGKHACGVAVFGPDKKLITACYADGRNGENNPLRHHAWARCVWETLDRLEEFDIADVVIEFPKVYPGAAKTDLNDLLDLAAVVGGIVERTGMESRLIYPREWKGQVPKKVMNARVLKQLSAAERENIEEAGAKTHNVLDAIGIGLWALGRLK